MKPAKTWAKKEAEARERELVDLLGALDGEEDRRRSDLFGGEVSQISSFQEGRVFAKKRTSGKRQSRFFVN